MGFTSSLPLLPQGERRAGRKSMRHMFHLHGSMSAAGAQYPLLTVLKQAFEGVDGFVLLAIPLFILPGTRLETWSSSSFCRGSPSSCRRCSS